MSFKFARYAAFIACALIASGCGDIRHAVNEGGARLSSFVDSLRLPQTDRINEPDDDVTLAARYLNGDGVPRDEKRALGLLRPAAERGEAEAQFLLGLSYRSGRGVAANDVEANRWLERAAKQEHAQAQYLLGLSYLRGRGVAKDSRQAVELFRQSALQGNAGAQYHLGLAHLSEDGAPRDDKLALTWLERAAEQGYAEAQYLTGEMYQNGRGTAANHPWAMRWFIKAGTQGLPQAQYITGLSWAAGSGVPRDLETAYVWLDLASRRGHKDAPKFRDGVAAKLEPSTLARAKSRSAAWRPHSAEETTTGRDLGTVVFVQQALNQLGYAPGPVDGVAGSRTRQALSDYQRKSGIRPTGEIGTESLAQLKNASIETAR
jgi:TPR repeat protein